MSPNCHPLIYHPWSNLICCAHCESPVFVNAMRSHMDAKQSLRGNCIIGFNQPGCSCPRATLLGHLVFSQWGVTARQASPRRKESSVNGACPAPCRPCSWAPTGFPAVSASCFSHQRCGRLGSLGCQREEYFLQPRFLFLHAQ